jgi:hypothetical protein
VQFSLRRAHIGTTASQCATPVQPKPISASQLRARATLPLSGYAIQNSGVARGCENHLYFIASGVGLSHVYCGHFWPIVPAPDDR